MRGSLFALLPLAMLLTIPRVSTAFDVSAPDATNYNIDGLLDPTLNLTRRVTYTFNVNASIHPFYIKTARVVGSGSTYDLGVTNNGVSIGMLTFLVPNNAPSQLFYQCGNHSAMGGTINITGTVGVEDPVSSMAWLGRATPNPVSHGTWLRLGLPRDAKVDVVLFDARGRKVRTLWNGPMTAGEHAIAWDGRDEARRQAPSGAYFYRMRVEGRTLTGRLVVAR
ncbi:MAG TPA: FlgD immunoglobulin-like domain containing protein [Candidatus Eisenbacteria bacterium]|nr:FlgD immunoglobulin-like domain containing protein [Candidatus Eisenbacteria bacterium]